MLKVGITGGIGSGKSLACQAFEILGVPVYYADTRAKEIMTENAELKASIIKSFGTDAYLGDTVNRLFLADIVFKNPDKLNLLNSIVHPAVGVDILGWFEKHIKQPYVIEESAILFEKGLNKMLDKTILVYAPAELRISRTMTRDNCPREAVLERMSHQIDQEEALKLADYTINNDGIQALIPQVLNIHEQLLNL